MNIFTTIFSTISNPSSATDIIIAIFGGMGIFLYGINLMGSSLKGLAGSKLKIIIEKSTDKAWKGILIGIALTAVIQSSSGMTAILIGLIAAGLMTLPQAIPVIMGANIGTTVTAVLVGLNIKEYSLAIVAVGAVISFFFKNKRINFAGLSILGLGLLFFGLQVMDGGLGVLAEKEFFVDVMSRLDNPFLGVLAGTVITGIIQSSSASIAILQQIYSTTVAGNAHMISLLASVTFVIGSNIGTTVTTLLSSIGASRNAKRAAIAHLIFNIIGCLMFILLLIPFNNSNLILQLLQMCEDNIPYFSDAPANTIALFHIVFNVVTTLVLCWFVKLLVKIVEKILPLTSEEELIKGIDKLEPTLIKKAPVLALENAKKVTGDMASIVLQMFEDVKVYVNNNDSKIGGEILSLEDVVDNYDNKLHDFLVQLSSTNMNDTSVHEQAICFDTIRDLERIGDHCVNLMEFMDERYGSNFVFKDESLKMINHMFELLTFMLNNAIAAFSNNDKKAARRVRATEPQIDELEKKYRRAEIAMLTSGGNEVINSDLHFVDILANLERIGDHSNNIADNILFNSLHDVVDEDIKSTIKTDDN